MKSDLNDQNRTNLQKPARIGLVATLYDQYTITHLTEALMNIYTSEKVAKNS